MDGLLLRILDGMKRDKAIQAIQSKLKGRSLLLKRKNNATTTARYTPGPASARRLQAVGSRRGKCCSVPVAEYSHVQQQHHLWQAYSSAAFSALDPITPQTAMSLCAELDKHGAHIEVVRSRSFSQTGLSGIVLSETGRSFCIMDSEGKPRTVLKSGAAVHMTLPPSVPSRVKVMIGDPVLLDGASLVHRDVGRR